MTTFNQPEVIQNIQEIIDKSRCSIDGFFVDSKTAANDILKYLENENIIIRNTSAVELEYNERNRAA